MIKKLLIALSLIFLLTGISEAGRQQDIQQRGRSSRTIKRSAGTPRVPISEHVIDRDTDNTIIGVGVDPSGATDGYIMTYRDEDDAGTTVYWEMSNTIKEFSLSESVYDDIYLPISITKLGATAPTWTAFHGNISQYTFAINDYVQGSFELPHGYKEGTDLNIHTHIVTNGAEASKEARYSFEYWIADSGESSTATVIITSDDKALTNADGVHEYIDMGDITGTGYKIGAIVCFLFKRVALVGGDSPSDDPFVVSVGCHYQIDTMGSSTETVK